jgi:hypothetical protein
MKGLGDCSTDLTGVLGKIGFLYGSAQTGLKEGQEPDFSWSSKESLSPDRENLVHLRIRN